MAETVAALIAHHAPDALAIGAPDRQWLTYGALRELSESVGKSLRSMGVGPNDRVAIVLNNGPEMAAAFMAVACHATTAPLNPTYRQEEFAFYLSDLNASAVILAADDDGPALKAANEKSIPVVRLNSNANAAAGLFTLTPPTGMTATASDTKPGADDVALVLHTSGTTSRPKIVPLLQRNLVASARHIGATLTLSPSDRCLNIMPLFHIHGLIAAVLSSLAAGGSIVCTPGFNALNFYKWLDAVKPSWYTAVPTMHQAILARSSRNAEIISSSALRFIRSSSASLPPQVMTALEAALNAPVIESYGMTEATHQMASNPLPPAEHKPGSVGIAAGPQVRVASETQDKLLANGETGEVVICGPNVTPGYESNPDANAKAFFEIDGERWFRTGDQGVHDDEGYLRITGRLKEIINRGGEKISPLEVDEVLMDHPAVQQVVTFGIPHDKLGEEVGAAVVLREGEQADEKAIRAFAAERLADFKVPRKVVLLDEIPKGATGKLQRIGLAEKLGLVSGA